MLNPSFEDLFENIKNRSDVATRKGYVFAFVLAAIFGVFGCIYSIKSEENILSALIVSFIIFITFVVSLRLGQKHFLKDKEAEFKIHSYLYNYFEKQNKKVKHIYLLDINESVNVKIYKVVIEGNESYLFERTNNGIKKLIVEKVTI